MQMKSYQELSKNNKLFSAKSYPPINSLAIVNLSLRVSKAKHTLLIRCMHTYKSNNTQANNTRDKEI